jgi:hypothetical protein
MWPHRPIGRALISAAVGLLAFPALWLDAAAPAVDGGLVAWHALSTLVLAGLALWALWSQRLPRTTGQALAGTMSLLLLGALWVAALRLPAESAAAAGAAAMSLPALASGLFIVGIRWARREIRW